MAYLLDDQTFDRLMRMLLEWESAGGAGLRPVSDAVGGFGLVPDRVGKLDTSLAAGGSATLSLWTFDGSDWIDSGEDMEVVAPFVLTYGSIAAGKRVRVRFSVGPYSYRGKWEVISAEC